MSQQTLLDILQFMTIGGGEPFLDINFQSGSFVVVDDNRTPFLATIADYEPHINAIIAAKAAVDRALDAHDKLMREISRINNEHESVVVQLQLSNVDPNLIPRPEDRTEDVRRIHNVLKQAQQIHDTLVRGLCEILGGVHQAREMRAEHQEEIEELHSRITSLRNNPSIHAAHTHADCLVRMMRVPGFWSWLESSDSGFRMPQGYTLTGAWVDEALSAFYEHLRVSEQVSDGKVPEPAERLVCMERILSDWGFQRWLRGPAGPGMPDVKTITTAKINRLSAEYLAYQDAMKAATSMTEEASDVHVVYSDDDRRRQVEEAQGLHRSDICDGRHDQGYTHKEEPIPTDDQLAGAGSLS